METLVIPAINTAPVAKIGCSGCNKCPDFDSDCDKIDDHLGCFIGINSEGIDIGTAKGYCPYIHKAN